MRRTLSTRTAASVVPAGASASFSPRLARSMLIAERRPQNENSRACRCPRRDAPLRRAGPDPDALRRRPGTAEGKHWPGNFSAVESTIPQHLVVSRRRCRRWSHQLPSRRGSSQLSPRRGTTARPTPGTPPVVTGATFTTPRFLSTDRRHMSRAHDQHLTRQLVRPSDCPPPPRVTQPRGSSGTDPTGAP